MFEVHKISLKLLVTHLSLHAKHTIMNEITSSKVFIGIILTVLVMFTYTQVKNIWHSSG